MSEDDPHAGACWGPAVPCWHEWPCPKSHSPHRCVYGRSHIAPHHCWCGDESAL